MLCVLFVGLFGLFFEVFISIFKFLSVYFHTFLLCLRVENPSYVRFFGGVYLFLFIVFYFSLYSNYFLKKK